MTTEIAPEAIVATAVANYSGKPGYDGITDCLFALLVDVADVYLARLEEGPGADEPAPFPWRHHSDGGPHEQPRREPRHAPRGGLRWPPPTRSQDRS